MNRHVNAIAGRLSLRLPQRTSLEILHRITELAPPRKNRDTAEALRAVRGEFPTVTDFEREFLSLCFALATGVGKTRLMGAFISYLHLEHGLNNFFVLAPNLTIYEKLKTDFTPNTPKYVFRGIAEFATHSPELITGENYENRAATLFDEVARCKINIFNISKINSEVRGGRSLKIRSFRETLGESYFEYLTGLTDLVLLMDESHRYRASAGVRAINELKPVLGLELTATPFVETSKGSVQFKNVVFDYPLGKAMADGFVKEPAVVTRKDFNPAGMSQEEIERLKLDDGVRLHESVKVELETYARESGNAIVKPFLLVIARDTTHAGQLVHLIESNEFFGGRYRGKVLQVDSSRTGADEDQMVERLLRVEHTDEPTEIVIHVNMLKEGWDVTNLYTIVPLRAANARILIEQSIGRGLRLPYGRRTGVDSVDRLNIVAHDRFKEIIDEASRPDSAIRLQQLILDPATGSARPKTVVSQSNLDSSLGITPPQLTDSTEVATGGPPPAFATPQEQEVARLAYAAIRGLENEPGLVPGVAHLRRPEVLARLVEAVEERYAAPQLGLEGVATPPDVAAIVARTAELVERQVIGIPRILVLPRGEVRAGYHPFKLDLRNVNYPPPSDELYYQYLRTHEGGSVGAAAGGMGEARLEDYVVAGLVDFNDIAYDEQAELLYDLATQVVAHLRGFLAESDVRKVLHYHRSEIARLVHAQMQDHAWEEAVEYEHVVSKGFTDLKPSAYTASATDPIFDFRQTPTDRANINRYLFGGFTRCLYPVQKFQSDTERRMAIVLDRDAERWFKPAKGQFQIFYRVGVNQPEYQPDFVAEAVDRMYMIEIKARKDLETGEVIAKRNAALQWCARASAHTATYGGKPWEYLLIPHDEVAENMSLTVLVTRSVTKR